MVRKVRAHTAIRLLNPLLRGTRREDQVSNWGHAGRYHGGFPTSVKRQAERTIPKVCAHCGTDEGALQLDHIHNAAEHGTNTIDNAQWLCAPCHDTKTRAEAARGRSRRAARGLHPTEAHPGLI